MTLSGKLSLEDLADVRRMNQSKWYWPQFVFANWYGLVITSIIIWATIDSFSHPANVNWKGIGILWVVVALIVAWAIYSVNRDNKKEFAQLNTSLPDRITLASDGLTIDGPAGAKGFQPWANFKGWREGKRVVLIDLLRGGFNILPMGGLSEVERQSIRGILESHVLAKK
jgi:hypothetical protein